MNNPSPHKSNWLTTGCMILAGMGLLLMCWLATLGYMSTLRMMGL